jgi:hypothetical protein
VKKIVGKNHVSNTQKKLRKYAIIQAIKSNTPCADCGMYYPYWVMDFDHVPERGSKSGPMTRFVSGHSVGKLMAEIAKCDVVCANCHRNRTHRRSDPEENQGV